MCTHMDVSAVILATSSLGMVPMMPLLFILRPVPITPPLSQSAPPLATHALQRMQFLSSMFGVTKQSMAVVVGDCVGSAVGDCVGAAEQNGAVQAPSVLRHAGASAQSHVGLSVIRHVLEVKDSVQMAGSAPVNWLLSNTLRVATN